FSRPPVMKEVYDLFVEQTPSGPVSLLSFLGRNCKGRESPFASNFHRVHAGTAIEESWLGSRIRATDTTGPSIGDGRSYSAWRTQSLEQRTLHFAGLAQKISGIRSSFLPG